MLSKGNPKKNVFKKQTSSWGRIFILFILVLAGAAGILFLSGGVDGKSEANSSVNKRSLPTATVCKLDPGVFQLQAEWNGEMRGREETVQKGESFSVVMDRLGVGPVEVGEIVQAAGDLADLTKIRAGASIKVYRNSKTGGLCRLNYHHAGQPGLLMVNTPAGWVGSLHKAVPIKLKSTAKGRIKTSLWDSAVGACGLDPELVMSMADIFAYDIDFFTEVQEGDEFALLYEDKFLGGRRLGSGRILAARFVNEGEVKEAFFHTDSKGLSGYYDGEGRSLKRCF